MAYLSATVKNLGENVSEDNLRVELDTILGDTSKSAEEKKTAVTTTDNGAYNVHFNKTNHDYSVINGEVTFISTN